MSKVTERLRELLDRKDEEIAELEEKLENSNALECSRNGWMTHRYIGKRDDVKGLPVPRLQIRYVKRGEDWRSREAFYELVYRHLLGHLAAVPLGHTRIDGGDGTRPIRNGKIDLPFRDGAHIRSESAHLKLPAFVLCEDVAQAVELPEGRS